METETSHWGWLIVKLKSETTTTTAAFSGLLFAPKLSCRCLPSAPDGASNEYSVLPQEKLDADTV